MNLKKCTNCKLSDYRTKVVVGKGKLQHNDILFIGEAPGMGEDETGEAFEYRSGELLEIMLNDALLKSKCDSMPSYFITNTVLCRPVAEEDSGKKNRAPTKVEKSICRRYLDRQIALIGD